MKEYTVSRLAENENSIVRHFQYVVVIILVA